MAMSRGKGPSCMSLALLAICLVSIASLIFLSLHGSNNGGSTSSSGANGGVENSRLKELEGYVKRLEEAIASRTIASIKSTYSAEESKDLETVQHTPPAHDPSRYHAHSLSPARWVSQIDDVDIATHILAFAYIIRICTHYADSANTTFHTCIDTVTHVHAHSSKENNVNTFTSVNTNKEHGKSALEEEMTSKWINSLASKLLCLRLKSGAIYLYHTRKAAGTSIRDILSTIASTWHVPYHETEGVVLNREIIDKKDGMLTVTSLRDPVARILSLYWYEHVGWYDGVLKQTERCKTLRQWVNAWKDGSTWKAQFIAKNPDSVYVEIDNYYVKMLSGWHAKNRQSRATRADLEIAKEVLRSFDLVLLSDWMGDSTQIEALNAIFPGRTSIAAGHKVRGDHNAKVRLTPTLAPDEEEVRKILTEMNALDLELYEYAQTLMAYRLKFIPPTVLKVKAQLGLDSHLNTVVSKEIFEQKKDQCAALDSSLSPAFKKKYVGIFQPPGHKGPF